MLQEVIGFDIDGVVLDIWGSVVRHLRSEGKDISPEPPTTYNFKGHPYREDIFRCFSNPDVFAKAELYDGIKEAFDTLDFIGFKYHYNTLSYNKDVEIAKIKRLEELLPNFNKSKYLSVIDTCDKVFTDATIVVEDNPHYFTSDDFRNSDKLGIIVDREYNQCVSGQRIKRVKHLNMLASTIGYMAHLRAKGRVNV